MFTLITNQKVQVFMFIFVCVALNKLLVWTFRYHYNVADSRLRQHVDKGNEDGLFISSVASSSNLWALIMDAGTGFSSQVYEMSPFFLHKVIPKALFNILYLSCSYIIDNLNYSPLCFVRIGSWNTGRRISISA